MLSSHSFQRLLAGLLLLGLTACQKNQVAPTPVLRTDGELVGIWTEKDLYARRYSSEGAYLGEETLPVVTPYKYELVLTSATYRRLNYAGTHITPDSMYQYTRQGTTMRVLGDFPEERTILELTEHRFTFQQKEISPTGSYMIVDYRFTR